MIFDFEKFREITTAVFPVGPYSLEDALGVFRCYFERYEEHTGKPHPPINASQIVRIVQNMPWICLGVKDGVCIDLSPDAYPAMIEQHFETRYHRCDYNINHFFSGRVRALRYYEACY